MPRKLHLSHPSSPTVCDAGRCISHTRNVVKSDCDCNFAAAVTPILGDGAETSAALMDPFPEANNFHWENKRVWPLGAAVAEI